MKVSADFEVEKVEQGLKLLENGGKWVNGNFINFTVSELYLTKIIFCHKQSYSLKKLQIITMKDSTGSKICKLM